MLFLFDGHFPTSDGKARRNSVRVHVRCSERVARGQVFLPMHYREAAANLLTNPVLDGPSGIPEFTVCAVRIASLAIRA